MVFNCLRFHVLCSREFDWTGAVEEFPKLIFLPLSVHYACLVDVLASCFGCFDWKYAGRNVFLAKTSYLGTYREIEMLMSETSAAIPASS